MIPVAYDVVHNFKRMILVRDPIFKEYVTDSVLVGEHVDINVDVMLDDNEDDAGTSTGTQQDALRMGAMNQLREVLADDMWDRYQPYPLYKTA